MELRKIYGKWDTGIGKYWHRIETTGGKSLKRSKFTTDCRATKEEEDSKIKFTLEQFMKGQGVGGSRGIAILLTSALDGCG
jgi:hypothetical protein